MNKDATIKKERNVAIWQDGMLLFFTAAALFKWYVYFAGYNYYEPAVMSEEIVANILSVAVVLLLAYLIKTAKDQWFSRYLISFSLFIILGYMLKFFGDKIFLVNSMPLIEAIYFSLFCLNLIFFHYIYSHAGFKKI